MSIFYAEFLWKVIFSININDAKGFVVNIMKLHRFAQSHVLKEGRNNSTKYWKYGTHSCVSPGCVMSVLVVIPATFNIAN